MIWGSMIWHFFEVWLVLTVAFAVGCLLGALLYGLIADSRLALVQGATADQIGDVVDRVKAAMGLGPAWRPQHLRSVERALPQPPQPELDDDPGDVEDPYFDDEELDAREEPPMERVEPKRIEPPRVERPRIEAPRAERPRIEAPPVERPRIDAPRAERPRIERPPVEPRVELPRLTEREPRRAAPIEREREVRRPVPAQRPQRMAGEELAFPGGDPDRIASAETIGADGVVPMRPVGLSAPRGGVPDNLTRIRGIAERNEALLNSLGIYHFGQIAAWTPGEMRWIGQYLAFPERIERDDWVGQAMLLATGADTGFEKSAERRRRRRLERNQDTSGAGHVADGVVRIMRPRADDDDRDDN